MNGRTIAEAHCLMMAGEEAIRQIGTDISEPASGGGTARTMLTSYNKKTKFEVTRLLKYV